MLIGEIISRVKTAAKLVNADANLSDRFVYNQIVTARDTLVKIEDDKKKIIKLDNVFKPLNKVTLIETDTVEACGIESNHIIKRTRHKIPKIVTASFGPIIKQVSSLDGSVNLERVSEMSFQRKLKIADKYNKFVYYFIKDDYMYFPNIAWDAVMIEAYFEDFALIDALNDECEDCNRKEVISCTPMQEREFPCPNYLLSLIIKDAGNELMQEYNRLKEDTNINKNPNA